MMTTLLIIATLLLVAASIAAYKLWRKNAELKLKLAKGWGIDYVEKEAGNDIAAELGISEERREFLEKEAKMIILRDLAAERDYVNKLTVLVNGWNAPTESSGEKLFLMWCLITYIVRFLETGPSFMHNKFNLLHWFTALANKRVASKLLMHALKEKAAVENVQGIPSEGSPEGFFGIDADRDKTVKVTKVLDLRGLSPEEAAAKVQSAIADTIKETTQQNKEDEKGKDETKPTNTDPDSMMSKL
jgi:hypothetical protein